MASSKKFTVSDGNLLDGDGNKFVIRGLCYGFVWCPLAFNPDIEENKKKFEHDMRGIRGTGANAVRLHLGAMVRFLNPDHAPSSKTTKTSPETLKFVLETIFSKGMIAILTVWDCSSYPGKYASQPLDVATKYWTETVKDVIVGYEDKVIINIANEPWDNAEGRPGHGKGQAWSSWYQPHRQAIKDIRRAGLQHVLMVDGPTVGGDGRLQADRIKWGVEAMQDPEYPQMRYWGARDLLKADKTGQVIFDVHIYYHLNEADKIMKEYFDAYAKEKIVVLVGEFSSAQQLPGFYNKFPKTAEAIVNQGDEAEVGYLGWAWNSGPPYLYDHEGETEWGKIIFPGLKKTKTYYPPISN